MKYDASGSGLGAVLTQDKCALSAYFNKALSEQNLTKSAYDLREN